MLAKIKHPEVLRFFLLSSHYRGPMNYSPDQLDQAEAALNAHATCAARSCRSYGGEPAQRRARIHAAMDDDFNIPEAIAVLQDWRATISARSGGEGDLSELRRWAEVVASGELGAWRLDSRLAKASSGVPG